MSTPKRLKVLWLCSWYPSEVEPFAGDFIQRHAEAVSRYADVYVVHAIGAATVRSTKFISGNRMPGLHECQCIYSKRWLWQKLFSGVIWFWKMFRMSVDLIRQEGKPDFLHVHVPYKSGLIARLLKFIFGFRYAVTEHWSIYNNEVADSYFNRSLFFRLLTRIGYQGAALSISVSTDMCSRLDGLFTRKSCVVVPNAVNTDLFKFGKNASENFRFIHVSDMSSRKNPIGILRAFKRLQSNHIKAQLILIGSDSIQSCLHQVYGSSTVAGIDSMSEVSYAEVAQQMRNSDCLLLFSFSENSPCVIGEALCCGLQVISSDVGGVSELIDEQCSELVPAGDEEALYLAMRRAIERAPNLDRKAIAQRAHARFSYEVVGRQIRDAYLKVLNG